MLKLISVLYTTGYQGAGGLNDHVIELPIMNYIKTKCN